jgi:hypothetical protein
MIKQMGDFKNELNPNRVLKNILLLLKLIRYETLKQKGKNIITKYNNTSISKILK